MTQMTHATTEGFDLNLVLSATQALPNALLDSVLEHEKDRLPTLSTERTYTLKQMCDKEFWRALPKVDRLRAGQCLSYLVEAKRLPLVPNGKTEGNALRYRLM